MEIRTEQSFRLFDENMRRLEDAVSEYRSYLINDQLEVESRYSIYNIALTILNFLSFWVGYDLLAHFRATRVCEEITRYCTLNRRYFEENPELAERITKNITVPFFEARGRSAQGEMTAQYYSILSLGRHMTAELENVSDQYLQDMEVSREDFEQVQGVFRHVSEHYNTAEYYLQFEKSRNGSGATVRTLKVCRKPFFSSYSPRYINPVVHTYNGLPFSVDLQYEGSELTRVVHLYKKVIGSGGERKVRGAFSTDGTKLIRAKCSTDLEEAILTHFEKHPALGLPRLYGWRTVTLPYPHPPKIQFLQRLYHGTVAQRINGQGFTIPGQKVRIIRELAEGLRNFHAYHIDLNSSHSAELIGRGRVAAFHHDVATDNVLWHPVHGAKLTDFGYACSVFEMPCKKGYISPEMADFYLSIVDRSDRSSEELLPEQIKNFNLQNAQAKDVWCMALVFLQILVGVQTVINQDLRDEDPIDNLPKLGFIREAFRKFPDHGNWDRWFCEVLRKTPEHTIHHELDQLKAGCNIPGFHQKDALWEVLKQMFKKDPRQRLTARQVHEALSPILAS